MEVTNKVTNKGSHQLWRGKTTEKNSCQHRNTIIKHGIFSGTGVKLVLLHIPILGN